MSERGSRPAGGVPQLSVDALPVGASFNDQGDGSGIFDWQLAPGRLGKFRLSFRAQSPEGMALRSALLKSNCPVTGQPDWADIDIAYRGPRIDRAALLRYLVSFRDHAEFHEQCVERIFMDIWARCKPAKLTVYARYTRRGGLDINPLRTSHPQALPGNTRTARQ